MGAPRILVVDDDPGVASVTARLLRRQGYNVTVAVGVEEAQLIAPREFALIVCDLLMPGGGVEAVRALWAATPFVTISGHITGADVEKGPHFHDELVAAVRARLAPPPAP